MKSMIKFKFTFTDPVISYAVDSWQSVQSFHQGKKSMRFHINCLNCEDLVFENNVDSIKHTSPIGYLCDIISPIGNIGIALIPQEMLLLDCVEFLTKDHTFDNPAEGMPELPKCTCDITIGGCVCDVGKAELKAERKKLGITTVYR